MSKNAIMPVYAPADILFVRGEGSRLFTANGDNWLDFICGIGVTGLGHAHPHLVSALREQADKLWHLSNMFRIEGQEILARRLVDSCFADRVFFTNSGAESIECAIKLARHYHSVRDRPERYAIISFSDSFHGRTLAAINAGANPEYRRGFGPDLPGFVHIAREDEAALERAASAVDAAAILVEPIQGEGGVHAFPIEWLQHLRRLCDDKGLLLIHDEVQCGCGRSGRLFAHQWSSHADPDIMAVAKGIGGGFPLGACLLSEDVAKGMRPGKHGSTYGGNPLAMAVGNAVWDILTEPGFLEQVNDLAARLDVGLDRLQRRHPRHIIERCGKGLLRGLRLHAPAAGLRAAALERRLLVGSAAGNVLRLAPPLNAQESEIDEAMEILDQCLISA